MTIGAVDVAASPLALEVEDHVGKGAALEQIVVNQEFAGTDLSRDGFRSERVVAGFFPVCKISKPKGAAAPAIYLSRCLKRSGQYGLAGCGVDEGEGLRRVLLRAFLVCDDQRLFWSLRFISDVVNHHVQLGESRRGE